MRISRACQAATKKLRMPPLPSTSVTTTPPPKSCARTRGCSLTAVANSACCTRPTGCSTSRPTHRTYSPAPTGKRPHLSARQRVECRLHPVERLSHQLRHIEHFRAGVFLFVSTGVEHDLAERAARGDHVGTRRFRFRVPVFGHTFRAGFLFLPELRTAGAAAERVFPAALHLHTVRTAASKYFPRRVELTVVAAQVARVVERHLPV